MMVSENMHKVISSWCSVWTRYGLSGAHPRADGGGLFPCKQFPSVPIFPLAGRCSSPRVTLPSAERLFGGTERQCPCFWWTQISPAFPVHAPCLEPSHNCSPLPPAAVHTHLCPVPFHFSLPAVFLSMTPRVILGTEALGGGGKKLLLPTNHVST